MTCPNSPGPTNPPATHPHRDPPHTRRSPPPAPLPTPSRQPLHASTPSPNRPHTHHHDHTAPRAANLGSPLHPNNRGVSRTRLHHYSKMTGSSARTATAGPPPTNRSQPTVQTQPCPQASRPGRGDPTARALVPSRRSCLVPAAGCLSLRRSRDRRPGHGGPQVRTARRMQVARLLSHLQQRPNVLLGLRRLD